MIVKKGPSRSTTGTRKLKLKKETVKNLSPRGQVKGGAATGAVCVIRKPFARGVRNTGLAC